LDVLLDDRDERAGVKFKDADLVGIPYRVTVGKTVADGKVEFVSRATGGKQEIPLDEVVTHLKALVQEDELLEGTAE
jgi:prolyl-tRNA synthetase